MAIPEKIDPTNSRIALLIQLWQAQKDSGAAYRGRPELRKGCQQGFPVGGVVLTLNGGSELSIGGQHFVSNPFCSTYKVERCLCKIKKE